MAQFVCTRCGKCCMNFGRYIVIERRISPSEFLCRFTLKNEQFRATMMPEHALLFRTTPGNTEGGSWCPFLREEKDGSGYFCTIYAHRPTSCRAFRCYSMKIFNRNGEFVGKVRSAKNLASSDRNLVDLWEHRITSVQAPSDQEWYDRAARILEEEGYRIEIFE